LHKDTCREKCGDGLNKGTYACDDGNNVGGDGCSSVCTIEDGVTCAGGSATSKDVCTEVCGDGRNMGVA
jgi:cysteine-rich repeat protein